MGIIHTYISYSNTSICSPIRLSIINTNCLGGLQGDGKEMRSYITDDCFNIYEKIIKCSIKILAK